MQPKTLLQIKDELAKEHGHSGWSAVKSKAVKGMLMVYDIIAFCDEANKRFYASQTKAVEPQQGWVDVKDRLPENETDVLIYSVMGRQAAEYKHNSFWVGLHRKQNVTHWMHLPEPPTQTDN